MKTDPPAAWAIPSVSLPGNASISPIPTGGYPSITSLLLPFGYLIGLAADVYSDPNALMSVINTASGSPSTSPPIEVAALNTTLSLFQKEILNNFQYDDDLALFANSLPCWSQQSFTDLAKKNYSHFAGHNLLFYLSYHLWAVSDAIQCANASLQNDANTLFISALTKEAFALHYLSDMFSAGHARVPRWTFLYGGLHYSDVHRSSQLNPIDADVISNLLHNHEGRLGCLVRNAGSTIGRKNFVWKIFGDGLLRLTPVQLNASEALIYAFNDGDTTASPATYTDVAPDFSPYLPAALQQAPSTDLRSFDHLCSLLCASLSDVFRHMATGLALEESGVDDTRGRVGLLGSILARVPYAMPIEQALNGQGIAAGLSDDIMSKLYGGAAYSTTQLTTRLQDIALLYETWRKVKVPKDSAYWFETQDDFKASYWAERFADPASGNTASSTLELSWLAAQTANLGTVFGWHGSNLSTKVPAVLVGTTDLPFTGVQQIDVTQIPALPASWIAAVPEPMMEALSSNALWGIVT
jgi:hypothetical protein